VFAKTECANCSAHMRMLFQLLYQAQCQALFPQCKALFPDIVSCSLFVKISLYLVYEHYYDCCNKYEATDGEPYLPSG